jgi:hypothetical protein
MPIAICIQKPTQPRREKAFARLSLIDGLKNPSERLQHYDSIPISSYIHLEGLVE